MLKVDVVNITIQIISTVPVPILLSGWSSPECCSFYKQNIEVWFGHRLRGESVNQNSGLHHNITDNRQTGQPHDGKLSLSNIILVWNVISYKTQNVTLTG